MFILFGETVIVYKYIFKLQLSFKYFNYYCLQVMGAYEWKLNRHRMNHWRSPRRTAELHESEDSPLTDYDNMELDSDDGLQFA